MTVATEILAVKVFNVTAGTPVPVSYPLYVEEEAYVYYGKAALLASYNVDYTITLGASPNFYTFTLVPTASLIAKINALIAADNTEVNFITIRRELPLLTASTPSNVANTVFTSREFDRITMKLQQLKETLLRSVVLPPTFVGNQQIRLPSPEAGRALIWNAGATDLENGPNAADIADAEANAAAAAAAASSANASKIAAAASAAAAAAALADGDKGDVIVSGSGSVWKVDTASLGVASPSKSRSNVSGSNAATTANVTNGSPNVALASALDFANGQGVRINNAGAAYSAANPTALAVGTQGVAGATSYTYTVAGISGVGAIADGGVGAAVAAVTINTGNAALSRANYNLISWTPAAGCIGYAVYKTIGGVRRLIGFTASGTFNDFGELAIGAPDWIPAVAPVASLNKWLITSIVSGGGTTALVLAAAPSRNAAGLFITHSDTVALQAWVNAAGNSPLFLSNGFYNIETPIVFNNGTNLSGAGRDLAVILLANPFQWGLTLYLEPASAVMSVSHIKISGQVNTDTGGAVLLSSSLVSNESYSAIFDTVSFNNSAYGLYIDRASSYKFVNSDVKGQHVAGIYLSNSHNADAGDGVIANNFISVGFGAIANIQYASGGGLKIIGNKLLSQPTASYGVLLNQTAGTSTAVLIIANNSIEGQFFNGVLAQNGAGAVWSNIIITGNELAGHINGVTINGLAGWLNNLTITGNSCQQNKSNGITVAGVTNYTITGNVLTGVGAANTIGIVGTATAFNGALSANAIAGYPILYSFEGQATVEHSVAKTSGAGGAQTIVLFTLGLGISYTSSAKCDFTASGSVNSVGGGMAFGSWGAAQAGLAGSVPTTVVVDAAVQTPANANNFVNSIATAADKVDFRTSITPGAAGSSIYGNLRCTGNGFSLAA